MKTLESAKKMDRHSARAAHQKYYWHHKPCTYGHENWRYVASNCCVVCQEISGRARTERKGYSYTGTDTLTEDEKMRIKWLAASWKPSKSNSEWGRSGLSNNGSALVSFGYYGAGVIYDNG